MKKLISLMLALILSLSVVGCGTKVEPIPAPDATVQALLDCLLKEDFSQLQTLFGYKSAEDVRDDLFDGQSVLQIVTEEAKDSLVGEDVPLSDENLDLLITAVFGAIGRSPITCQTVSMDEENKIAVVAVTVHPYSVENFEADMVAAIQPVLMENLELLTDEEAMYSLLVGEIVKYLDTLTPSEETVTINVSCTLKEHTINGQTRPVWMPEDEFAFGEEVATSIFPM